MKKEEDEMTLPYLVFRTWRDYYVKLLDAYKSFQVEDFPLAQRQMHKARKYLIESKKILLQRGMSVDDGWIAELDAMIINNMEFISSLLSGDHEYLYRFMDLSLEVVETYREWAKKRL